jgi:hypothetical protein
MEHFSKIIPESLAEAGNMEYLNLIILGVIFVLGIIAWKLPDIIDKIRRKYE